MLYKQWNGKIGELTKSRFDHYREARGLTSHSQGIEAMLLEAFGLETSDQIAEDEFPTPPKPFMLPIGSPKMQINFRTSLSTHNAYRTVMEIYNLNHFQHFIDLLIALIQGATSEDIITAIADQYKKSSHRAFDIDTSRLGYTHRTIHAKLKLIRKYPQIVPIFYDERFNLNIPTRRGILIYPSNLYGTFANHREFFQSSHTTLLTSPLPQWLTKEIRQDTKDVLREAPYSSRQLYEYVQQNKGILGLNSIFFNHKAPLEMQQIITKIFKSEGLITLGKEKA